MHGLLFLLWCAHHPQWLLSCVFSSVPLLSSVYLADPSLTDSAGGGGGQCPICTYCLSECVSVCVGWLPTLIDRRSVCPSSSSRVTDAQCSFLQSVCLQCLWPATVLFSLVSLSFSLSLTSPGSICVSVSMCPVLPPLHYCGPHSSMRLSSCVVDESELVLLSSFLSSSSSSSSEPQWEPLRDNCHCCCCCCLFSSVYCTTFSFSFSSSQQQHQTRGTRVVVVVVAATVACLLRHADS